MSAHHTVECRPNHCHWGFFDAALKPVVTVASGDTVTVDCVSGGRDILPTDPAFEILADHRAIHGALTPRLGAHILTGPVAVAGAPSRATSCRSTSCRRVPAELGLHQDPAARRHAARGFPDPPRSGTAASTGSAASPPCRWGAEIELAPFFGVMGVAPPPVYGACQLDPAARVRRQHGFEGAGRRHDALSAGMGAGRACFRLATGTASRATAKSA